MKKLISFLFLTLILGLAQTAFARADGEIQLRRGQQKTEAGSRLKIKFVSVTEDSRCPMDAKCIWAGNAKVNIQVTGPRGETKVFELNTNAGRRGNQFGNYAINLESLNPARRSNKKIRQSDYRVTISVNRLAR
jgi:hypothetical protein